MKLDLEAIRAAHPLPSVVAGAGVKLRRAGGEWKARCPWHRDSSPSFSIYGSERKWICFAGCGGGDVLDFVQRAYGVDLRGAAELLGAGDLRTTYIEPLPAAEDKSLRIAEAGELWNNAAPAIGSPVQAYLHHRGICLPMPDALRFTELRYGRSGPKHPVMLAAVTLRDGSLCGVQRTYLKPDGRGKLDVDAPKLSLGRIAGGGIRLTPPSAKLAVTEGIEDSLSVTALLGVSAWAAGGAGMLARMTFPPMVREVTVCGDADDAGRAAVLKAAKAYAERGLTSRVLFPGAPHKDWNDELRSAL